MWRGRRHRRVGVVGIGACGRSVDSGARADPGNQEWREGPGRVEIGATNICADIHDGRRNRECKE